eukprot:CAMPEP_0181297594 /NCGR_PEP_ID=MMETSP1101-20121128/5322_1 /TAXON_ID=46948 /ORGANISM="Rhodomonas abbreviata, Strain Caron Lab Isolate" /LENGTH=112 /DNA_ID=CAMNT_0023402539 /DNA_START=44 /DNA_END=382 /DNA_ORIENTATION=-
MGRPGRLPGVEDFESSIGSYLEVISKQYKNDFGDDEEMETAMNNIVWCTDIKDVGTNNIACIHGYCEGHIVVHFGTKACALFEDARVELGYSKQELADIEVFCKNHVTGVQK